MKIHVGTDKRGHVHHMEVTKASVSDGKMLESCLHGEEQEIYGDKAYENEEKKKAAEEKGIQWCVLRKRKPSQKLSDTDKQWNRDQSRIRSFVEHGFRIVKDLWGHRRTRYRGLSKNRSHYYAVFALANFYMMSQELPCLDYGSG